MKRIVIVLVYFIIIIIQVSSDEYQICLIEAEQYVNEYLGSYDSGFMIKYDDIDDLYFFVAIGYYGNGWVELQDSDIEKLRNICEKYFEWNKLAIEKQATIEKDIPDSLICSPVTFEFGPNWYYATDFELHFVFSSVTSDKHILKISSNNVKSDENRMISFGFSEYSLNYDSVVSFIEGISEDSIQKVKNDYEKQKAVENLFQ